MTLAALISQFYRPSLPSYAAVIAPIRDALIVAATAGSGHAIAPSVASLFEEKYGATPKQASEAATTFAETYVNLSWNLFPDFIGEYTFEVCAEILDYENQVISMSQAAEMWGKVDLKNSPVRVGRTGKLKFTTIKWMSDHYGPPKKSIV